MWAWSDILLGYVPLKAYQFWLLVLEAVRCRDVASGVIGIFYSQIVESSSLVSVLFREAISHPYISFFHLLVNGFSVTSFRTFSKTPYLYYTGGRYRWAGRN